MKWLTANSAMDGGYCWEWKLVQPPWTEVSVEGPQKARTRPTTWASSIHPEHIPKDSITYSTGACSSVFTAALFPINRNRKQPRCPSMDRKIAGMCHSGHVVLEMESKASYMISQRSTNWAPAPDHSRLFLMVCLSVAEWNLFLMSESWSIRTEHSNHLCQLLLVLDHRCSLLGKMVFTLLRACL